ncbi:DNA binding protein [Quillaja saponaria]|uniref:DNA binding protein n=1 Tax=Quillaja saponaria TaxID=32244 RepID=A0AAD7LBZ3_QUISA|nr:DNA binding protein [Quillaja saponaria]
MKRNHPLQPASCNSCGTEQLPLLLHNVRFRANFVVFCTNCVLKHHPGLFCPICLEVYDDPPPTHLRLICFQCPAIAHSSCIAPTSYLEGLSHTFHCPSCFDPQFSFFKLKTSSDNPSSKKAAIVDGEGDPVAVPVQNTQNSRVPVQNPQNSRAIDKDSAKVLVAAAKIAAVSMERGVSLARVEAERCLKEAALAKKRAREALEHVGYLVAKERDSNGVQADQKEKPRSDNLGALELKKGDQDQTQIVQNAVSKDDALQVVPPRNDISVAGIGSDEQSPNMQIDRGQ